jgi:hypothetical protein
VYGRTKIDPADQAEVETLIELLSEKADQYSEQADALPTFFHCCFSKDVRRYLLAARDCLNWRRRKADRTLMALLLVYLHGKRGAALSNQMRQTKAFSPDYAVRWWQERDLQPPEIDPVTFMNSRLKWRYAKGVPHSAGGHMYLGDSVRLLDRICLKVQAGLIHKISLLFTSPPYYGVTNYHYDQWLRIWLLGGPPNALRTGNAVRGKFEHRGNYKKLLERVFRKASSLLDDDAIVYVRTDSREYTYHTTRDVLIKTFPNKKLTIECRPVLGSTQTKLFGHSIKKHGEIDLVLQPM